MQRKPEQKLNDKILAALAGWDPQRIENCCGEGYPDINYINGWIEDKQVEEWPKRADTPLRIPHYTAAQRGWHMRRRKAGGRVHVALWVRETDAYYLFDAYRAAQHLGIDWTKQDCGSNCMWMSAPGWSPRAFRAFIEQCDRDRA